MDVWTVSSLVVSGTGIALQEVEKAKNEKLRKYSLVLEAEKSMNIPSQQGGDNLSHLIKIRTDKDADISQGSSLNFTATMTKEGIPVKETRITLVIAKIDGVKIEEHVKETNEEGKAYFKRIFCIPGKFKITATAKLPGIL